MTLAPTYKRGLQTGITIPPAVQKKLRERWGITPGPYLDACKTCGQAWIPPYVIEELLDQKKDEKVFAMRLVRTLGEMRIVDAGGRDVPPGEVGELIVKQPGFCGYLGQPEKTVAVFKEGWFYTGNMVSMDEDGFIYLQCKREDIGMLPADKSGKFVMPYKAQDSIVNELDDVVEASLITTADPTYRVKFRIIVRAKAEARVSEEQIK